MAAPLIELALAFALALQSPSAPVDESRAFDRRLAELESKAAQLVAQDVATGDELWSTVCSAVDLLYLPDAGLDGAALVDRVARAVRPLAERDRALRGSDELPAKLEFELASFALDRADAGLATRLLTPALARWPADLALVALAAEAAMQCGEWDAARARLTEAERLAADASGARDPSATGLAALERILFELRLGRSDRAWLALDELLAAPDTPPEIEIAALAGLADLELLCDRPADALATAERALASHDAAAVPQLALARALALADGANPEDRRTALEHVGDLDEALRRPGLPAAAACLGMLRAAELEIDANERGRARERLVAVDRIVAGEGRDRVELRRERGLYHALLARALREPGASESDLADADAHAAIGLEVLVEEWRATPLLPGGISFLRSATRRTVVHEAVVAALHEGGKGGAERAFRTIVELQAFGTWSRRDATAAPTTEAIRAALASAGELVLVYLPTRRGSHLFALDGATLEHFDVPGERELAASLATLRRQLLPDALLPRLAGASLIRVVGAELLGDVAFEELPLPDGRPLGTVRPIAHLPSLPVGVALRARRSRVSPSHASDFALLVGPAASPDGRSRFSIDEAALLATFPRARVVRPDAEALARGELPPLDVDVAAFVAHGVVDRRRDRFCGLALATGSDGAPVVAWADAFERASLPSLVALVACGAGEGPVRVGEDGAAHLGGAALAAGATSVLLGRGELDAEASLALLRSYLAELASGVPCGEALRRARAGLAADPERLRRARLELLGLGDETVSRSAAAAAPPDPAPKSRSGVATLAVLSALLLGAGGWLLFGGRRRRARP